LKAMNQKHWLSGQNPAQRITGAAFPVFPTPNLALPSGRAFLSNLSASIPSWVLLVMIMLGTLVTASAVIVRTRGEFQFSAQQYQRTASENELLRRGNAVLSTEIVRMRNDPMMIESVARARLGMVRPNDIVVPAGSIERSNLGTLSLAR